MTPPPHVRWSEDRADLIGSPHDIRRRLAAQQAGELSQSGTRRSATQPEAAFSWVEGADADPTIPAKTTGPRSPRSLWADRWQR
jgi:hypothetical protein